MTADGCLSTAAAAAETTHGGAAGQDPRWRREAFLAADIGGTHARIAWVAATPDGVPEVLAWRVYACAAHAGIEAIVRAFCREYAISPRRLVMACAGYLHEGRVVNDNLAWPVVPAAIGAALGLDGVDVLNDFEALAHAVAYADPAATDVLHAADAAAAAGPLVVLGPGTGLGVAVRLPGTPPRVLATEAGQIQLAARAGLEQRVLEALASEGGYVPYERVLSGPGVLRLYRILCAWERRPAVLADPAAVTAAACAASDAQAVAALELFCGWLGSFAGDLAMMYGARGVYVAGGFVPRIAAWVQASPFAGRFLDKGVMRPFLRSVPVHAVEHGRLGVLGAARWLIGRRESGPAT